MLSAYLQPILMAVFVFTMLAFLGTVPWTLYQYRKHGYFNFWRSFMVFSFIFYGLSAFFLVSLPFPENRHNLPLPSGSGVQLNPLNFIFEFSKVPGFSWGSPGSYLKLIKSFTFLEVVFNTLLLLPLGVYLRYYLKKISKVYWAFIAGLGVSLLFEVSQLTALFGYFDHQYRIFDVVDLMTNTTGAVLGYLIAPLFLFFVPSRDAIKTKDEHFGPEKLASYGAQLFEIWIVLTIVAILSHIPFPFMSSHTPVNKLIWGFMLTVVYPLLLNGRTLGGFVLRLKIDVGEQPFQFIKNLLFRFFLIFAPSVYYDFAAYVNTVQNQSKEFVMMQVFFVFGSVCLFMFITFDILRKWLKKYPRPYFNQMANIDFLHYRKEKKK